VTYKRSLCVEIVTTDDNVSRWWWNFSLRTCTDERLEWEVIGRPFATAAGKAVHVRLRKVSDPLVTELWTWAAHEQVSVKRPTKRLETDEDD